MAFAFKRAINYWSTYLLLVKDYVAYLGAKAIPVIGSVITAGLLYPLPFAIMAVAVYAMMAGQDVIGAKVGRWEIEVTVDSTFLYALMLGGVVLTFNYFAIRMSLTATTSWQTSLLWRGVNQLPVMARWDTETSIPLPLRPERLGTFLSSLARSGFVVGRLLAIALPNFAIVVGSLFALAWFDPISVAVLAVVALLYMPFYAWALLALIAVRQRSARNRPQRMEMLKKAVQAILASSVRIDTQQLAAEDARHFDSGYSIINTQLQGLNLIRLVAGVHVLSSIAIIYLLSGASLSTFVREKVLFFVVLLFMMRAALSLALLISRLSRAYTSLATLRAYLHPRRKRTHQMVNAPADAMFSLAAPSSGLRYPICKGKPVIVVMPNAAHACELLPLSNALEILKVPGKAVLRHIVFLDTSQLQVFLKGGADPVPVSTLEVFDKKQAIQLPVHYVSLDHEQIGVVALTLRAWKFLVEGGYSSAFCRDRIVFLVLSEPRRLEPPAPDTLLVVSDCVEIVGVGPIGETWDGAVEEAFQRAASRDIQIDFDDNEELA